MLSVRSKTSIVWRIYLIIVGILFGIFGVYYISAATFREAHYKFSNYHVFEAVKLVTTMATIEAEKGRARKEAVSATQRTIIDVLEKSSHGYRDYYWILSTDGTMLWHPVFPELNGKKVTELTDAEGKKVFKNVVALVKEKGGGLLQLLLAGCRRKKRSTRAEVKNLVRKTGAGMGLDYRPRA